MKGKAQQKKAVGRRSRLTAWNPKPRATISLLPGAALALEPAPKLARIVRALGESAAADILGVDRAQLNRCQRGGQRITIELGRRISDVEYVLERAIGVMHADEIGAWLTSPEPLLGESTPLNVLALHGAGRVVEALEALYAGVLV
jgi:uncharacterized protein (DUF2384 family)